MTPANKKMWSVVAALALVILAVWALVLRGANNNLPDSSGSTTSSQPNPIQVNQSQGQLPVGGGAPLQSGSVAPGASGSDAANPQQSLLGM